MSFFCRFVNDKPIFRQQSWDDFANKAGRSRGIKCEVVNPDGSTADGFVGYMDRQRSKSWEQFIEGGVEKKQVVVEDVTSRKENAVIERLNVNMDSDNDGDGHESDEEGGPGSKEVKKVLTYAEHQKIKLDRLFDKCKDGRAVFIPEMPSKIPERDVNQVRDYKPLIPVILIFFIRCGRPNTTLWEAARAQAVENFIPSENLGGGSTQGRAFSNIGRSGIGKTWSGRTRGSRRRRWRRRRLRRRGQRD